MTGTLIPEQLAEAIDPGTEGELFEPEDNGELQKLAALLAQSFVAMPLFP